MEDVLCDSNFWGGVVVSLIVIALTICGFRAIDNGLKARQLAFENGYIEVNDTCSTTHWEKK